MSSSLSAYKPWQDIQEAYALRFVSESLKTVDPKTKALVRATERLPIIRDEDGKRGLDLGTWGFPPPEGRSSPIINARCETMDVLPTFAQDFEQRRCVVPVTGYYEWKKEVDGNRTPWAFTLEGENEGQGAGEGEGASLFGLAGLFMADRKTGERNFLIVTTEPNEIAAEIHDRMPVILTESMMDIWLSPQAAPNALKRLCRPYEGTNLVAKPVSKTLHQPPKYVDENQLGFAL